MKLFKVVAIGAALALGMSAPAFAQSKTPTAQEQANLKLVLDWWREVLQAGHLDLAPKYMAEDYIQHNPNVPSGRKGFMDFFGPRAKPEPIKAEWKDKPALVITSGNLILLMFDRIDKDPADPTKMYKWNWFDMVRVDDGMIQEHWDQAVKNPPRPAAAG